MKLRKFWCVGGGQGAPPPLDLPLGTQTWNLWCFHVSLPFLKIFGGNKSFYGATDAPVRHGRSGGVRRNVTLGPVYIEFGYNEQQAMTRGCYCMPMKLREGNAFSRVCACHSVCPQGHPHVTTTQDAIGQSQVTWGLPLASRCRRGPPRHVITFITCSLCRPLAGGRLTDD